MGAGEEGIGGREGRDRGQGWGAGEGGIRGRDGGQGREG